MTDDQWDEKLDDEKILEKLKRLLSEKESEEVLNSAEIAKLRKMIAIYESFQAFGRFTSAARNIVLFVGSLLIGWFVLVDNLGIVWQKLLHSLGLG